jgi:hypothetical protein
MPEAFDNDRNAAPGWLVHRITDRELLMGIFLAITGLAEKLTGERMTVFIPTAVGDLPHSGAPVAWSPIQCQRAAEDHDARPLSEHSSTQFAPPQ